VRVEATLPGGVAAQPGEQVLAVMYRWWLAMIGITFFTLGLGEIWRRRHYIAVTNQRVLYGRGILSRTRRTIPLERVQDVTYHSVLGFIGGIDVSSAGGEVGTIRDSGFRPKQAKEFVNLLNERIHRPGLDDGLSRPAAPVTGDVAESLEQLKTLKDEGLLTDREYATKREEILSRL
jgi:Bacterial PH domain